MILVDSSIWIDFLSRKKGKFGAELERLMTDDEDLAVADLIVMEVLQGIREDEVCESVRKLLLDFPVYVTGGVDACLKSSEVYRVCRKKGLTIRKSIDCLLAVLAMDKDLEVFHKDRDFDLISKVTPLRIHKF